MLKSKAIELLGGTITAAAAELGVTYQAIDKWPDALSERVAQRVLGAIAQKRYPELAAEVAGRTLDTLFTAIDRGEKLLPTQRPSLELPEASEAKAGA